MGCAPSIHISETQTVYPGAREAEAAPQGPAVAAALLPPTPGRPGAQLRFPEPEAAAAAGAPPAEPRDSKVRAPAGRAGTLPPGRAGPLPTPRVPGSGGLTGRPAARLARWRPVPGP